MPRFDPNEFQHLKKLCRIECSPEEEPDIFQSLSRVLEYVDQLKEVPTEGVKTCNYVLRSMLKNKMREDVVSDVMARGQLLGNCPDQIGGMIRVPPILKPQ